MDRDEIEVLASEVRGAMGQTTPLVDVLCIAREEGILLAPGNYGPEFDGRIEYHPAEGKFILFYPEIGGSGPRTRVRFSVGHELGHYYIAEHRKLLIRGQAHNSRTGFICDNKIEREADFFAAALLIPRETLADFCVRKEFFTLKELVELANAWQASATCAAIRYTQWASECCAVVLSENGHVKFYIPSDDAAYRGFKWLGTKMVAPRSATMKAAAEPGSGQFFGQKSHSESWFSERKASCEMWEEAFPLGYTELVLTMLTFEVEDSED